MSVDSKEHPDEKDETDEQGRAGDLEAAASPGTDTPTGDTPSGSDYSSFTVTQKRCIVLAGAFAGWFSPMTGSIYFPALNVISKDLNVSATQINLTVTTYLIIQGIAPMFVAGFSDKAGRRPAYMACFLIYIAANIGLGLQNSYTTLLILRMLQSAGSSGTIALANGLVGDLVTSSERGMYIAFASLGSILGPSLSPVIGGLISQYLDWHWIFWFLLILSIAFAVPFLIFLPETCRSIVDDGTVPPPRTSWNVSDYLRHKHRAKSGLQCDEEKLRRVRENYKLTLPSPLPALSVLTNFEAALLLLTTGLGFCCYYAICTGASDIFSSLYGFTQLEVGLVFLSIGAGSIISAFTTGQLVDFNYRRHARKLNMPVEKNRQTDLSDFPIEQVRLEIALPLLLSGAASVLGYGWMMTREVTLAGPVIMLFILGYCLIAGFQCLNVLMVDIYPGRPASATAANNVVRCLLGAAATAAIDPMTKAVGYGWAYTILALLFAASCGSLVVIMRHGIRWRKQTREVQARREERRK